MSIFSNDVNFHPEGNNKKPNIISHSNKKEKSLPAKKKKDRWAGGSLKRRCKNDHILVEGDQEDWKSDDSDWLCTDDEDFSSDNDSNRRVKRNSKYSIFYYYNEDNRIASITTIILFLHSLNILQPRETLMMAMMKIFTEE